METTQHEAIHEWFSLSYANYLVLNRPARVIEPMDECPDCAGQGFNHGGPRDGEECETCQGYGEVPTNEGQRYETGEEVGYRADPIPHVPLSASLPEGRGS